MQVPYQGVDCLAQSFEQLFVAAPISFRMLFLTLLWLRYADCRGNMQVLIQDSITLNPKLLMAVSKQWRTGCIYNYMWLLFCLQS